MGHARAGKPAAECHGRPGGATQHHRYRPGVALAAAGHDGYMSSANGGSLYGGRNVGLRRRVCGADGDPGHVTPEAVVRRNGKPTRDCIH